MVHRAGLIGCGGVGRSHFKGLQAARNVELVALAEVFAPHVQTAGKAYGSDHGHLQVPLPRRRTD